MRPSEVTHLLEEYGRGDRDALERLMPVVYEELRRIAVRYIRKERVNHTLQPTALVNEAYLRLADQQASIAGRAHFFGIAARLMRQILVDYARSHGSQKRGGGLERVTLDEGLVEGGQRDVDLIVLNDALVALAEVEPRLIQIVELRYFAGLSIEETAAVLDISPATVKREWAMAKAFLRRRMEGAGPHGE